METTIKDTRVTINMDEMIVPQYVSGWRIQEAKKKGREVHSYHNVVFEDEFEIIDFHSSRSSVYITVRSTNTGMLYYMRWWAMKDLLKNGELSAGKFHGIFVMKKAWDYTALVMFDPKALKEGMLHGPDWWRYARPWVDER